MQTTGVCAGCGKPTTPTKFAGKPHKWCSEKCRKGSYGQSCIDCGVRTSYGAEAARVPDPRCPTCAVVARTIWTPETIVAAIREWADIYGEPPASSDWNPYQCRAQLGDEARAARFEQDDRWPWFAAVVRAFGSWGEGVRAAGFDARPAHGGGGNVARRRSQRALAA